MWRPHSVGDWLAIIALLLAYPLSLLANLSTPLIKDWWAKRSEASARKRQEEIRSELKVMGQHVQMTDSENLIASMLRVTFLHLFLGVHIILSAGFIAIDMFDDKHQITRSHTFLFGSFVAMITINSTLAFLSRYRINEQYKPRSLWRRQRLERTYKDLSQKYPPENAN